MDEVVFYISNDKNEDSYAYITSIHSSKQYATFRHANSLKNSTCLTGIGPGERVISACTEKSLIHIYSYGKESIDQKIPIPEPLTALCIIPQIANDTHFKLPNFRLPWLLIGGSKSGKLYIWELSSGNLLNVKDGHYQGITVIKSKENFLVTGGEDARVIVWNLFDLINCYHQENCKPYWSITDNTLPITDLTLNDCGVINDLKLYTVSKDSTLRIYDLMTKSQLTTFVLSQPIECVCRDPASRVIYVGLANGQIRSIPLYNINSYNSTLESIGGNNKIITVENDPDLKQTFVHHTSSVTCMSMNIDGTCLISGDSKGQVFVSDVISKQVIKQFQPCNGPISFLQTQTIPTDIQNSSSVNKKHRMIPQLKRVLIGTDPIEHTISLDIPELIHNDEDDFETWLNQKKIEEMEFKNSFSDINTTVKSNDLESKLTKVSNAYTDLRTKHEELIKEHSKLLDSLN